MFFRSKKENKTLRLIKIILWLVPIGIFGWLLNQHFVPGGTLEMVYQVDQESNVFTNFASKERYKLLGTENTPGASDVFQLITTSPLYFNTIVPRPFASADVYLKYQNPDSQPVMRLGVEQPTGGYYFTDMAFLNPVLENLPPYWHMMRDNDLVLWQKDNEYEQILKANQTAHVEATKNLEEEYKIQVASIEEQYGEEISEAKIAERQKRLQELQKEYKEQTQALALQYTINQQAQPEYESIDSFFDKTPSSEKILQYNYDLITNAELPGYETMNKKTVITHALRGPHDIYTYVGKGENLDFTFTIQDINRHVGADIFTVQVYDIFGNLIEEVTAPDDGEDQRTGRVFPERRHQLLIEDIPHGTYRLKIDLPDDDIFIKKIETDQHLLMFKGNIYLADNAEYRDILLDKEFSPTTLYTTAKSIEARTAHDDGYQVLRVGRQNININETHLLYEADGLSGITPIVSPKNDVYISGKGFFAFSRDQMFDTTFGLATDVAEADIIDSYEYIIAKYPKAKQQGEWYIAAAHVEVPELYFHEGIDLTANFIITMPGLPEHDRVLQVKEVRVVFHKEPIKLNNIVEKIKNKILK